MYKADIYFDAIEDNYKDGENVNPDNWWKDTLTAVTTEELKTKIEEATYTKWSDIDFDDFNDTDTAICYIASYYTNEDNEGEASDAECELFKQGKKRLWSVHCRIMVSKVTESKVEL